MFSVIDFVPFREHSALRSKSTSKALTPIFGEKYLMPNVAVGITTTAV
jgi:hypothetical protein